MKKLTILILPLLLLFLTSCDNNYAHYTDINNETNEYNNNNNNENNSNNNDDDNLKITESDIMIAKISSLIDSGKAYDTGSYISGEVAKGEYAFVKFKGSGSYYEEEDKAGEILDNENFSSFGYVKVHGVGNLETRGVLININSFEELGVTGAKEIYEKINDVSDYLESGYYKVGVDIQPGKYTLESLGSGYYAILTGPVGNSDIVSNDNFNGKKQITVRSGQYLELSRVQILK